MLSPMLRNHVQITPCYIVQAFHSLLHSTSIPFFLRDNIYDKQLHK